MVSSIMGYFTSRVGRLVFEKFGVFWVALEQIPWKSVILIEVGRLVFYEKGIGIPCTKGGR